MTKKNVLKFFEGLFNKIDSTESGYIEVLERKEEELLQLQTLLQEKEFMLKDMHKAKLLNAISDSAYNEAKVEVDDLKEKVQEIQKEVTLINQYKREDILQVLEEIEYNKKDLLKGKQEELNKIKLELLDAKLVYLQKMKDAGEAYDKLVQPEKRIDALSIKMGLKKNSYVSGSYDALSVISVKGSYVELTLDNYIVSEALGYKRLPSQLVKMVQDAKDKGIIE